MQRNKLSKNAYDFKPLPRFKLLGTGNYQSALVPGTIIFNLRYDKDGDVSATHTFIYAPKADEVNDICHVTVDGFTRHSLSYYVEITSPHSLGYAIIKPRNLAMGQLAADQARFWSQTGAKFDTRRTNMVSAYESVPAELKQNEMLIQDEKNFSRSGVFHVLQRVTQLHTKPNRMKLDAKEERGKTCVDFVVDSYNASWCSHLLAKFDCKIDKTARYSIKYTDLIKHKSIVDDVPGYREYVELLRMPSKLLSVRHQFAVYPTEQTKPKHCDSADFPRCDAVPPVAILPPALRKNLSHLANKLPIPLNTKYLGIGELFNFLALGSSAHFELVGITNISATSPKDAKQLNKQEILTMSLFSKNLRKDFVKFAIERDEKLMKFKFFLYLTDEDLRNYLLICKLCRDNGREYINTRRQLLA